MNEEHNIDKRFAEEQAAAQAGAGNGNQTTDSRAGSLWKRLAARIKPWGNKLHKFVSVPFLLMLLLSLSLWYIIKLGYDYKTELPVRIDIEGHQFEVNCMVEGRGTNLVGWRYSGGNEIVLTWNDVDVTPSAVNPGWVVISPYSLQNAISARSSDIKILSVGMVPEIEL